MVGWLNGGMDGMGISRLRSIPSLSLVSSKFTPEDGKSRGRALVLVLVLARSTADDLTTNSSYSLQACSSSISNIRFTSCMRFKHGLGAKE